MGELLEEGAGSLFSKMRFLKERKFICTQIIN